MLNITAIVSLSSIAYMATIGLQSIVFYLLAAFLFLLPSSLVCAELSSMMTQNNGGVFTWVKAGLGDRCGVIAMWLEWFNNVISFPVTISAIIASVAYLGFGSEIYNKSILSLAIIIVFWLVTFFNFLPIKKVFYLNILGAIFGMILPGVLLVIGAIYYWYNGATNIKYTGVHDFIPSFSLATYAILVKTLSSYSGIQSVAFHMKNIDQPQKNIPKAIFISVLIIVVLTILSTCSLIAIIPVGDVNVLNGLVQGISKVLDVMGLSFMRPVIVFLVALGMLSSLSTWILGPARGMQEAAEREMFPRSFSGKNKNGMPINMLLIQVCVGTVITLAFLVMPSIYAAFALLIALTAQFTVLMWIMVFVSAVRLRYIAPDYPRVFYVGSRGSNCGLIVMVSLAIIACLLGFVSGIFPPAFSKVQTIWWYIILVIMADIIIISIPLLWVFFYKQVNQKI
jgi:amino acid transporter